MTSSTVFTSNRSGGAPAQGRGVPRGCASGRHPQDRAQPGDRTAGQALGRSVPEWPQGQRRLPERAGATGSGRARVLLMLTYMLDTNICIYVMKTYPPAVLEKFNARRTSFAYRALRLASCIMARRSPLAGNTT